MATTTKNNWWLAEDDADRFQEVPIGTGFWASNHLTGDLFRGLVALGWVTITQVDKDANPCPQGTWVVYPDRSLVSLREWVDAHTAVSEESDDGRRRRTSYRVNGYEWYPTYAVDISGLLSRPWRDIESLLAAMDRHLKMLAALEEPVLATRPLVPDPVPEKVFTLADLADLAKPKQKKRR